MVISKISTGPNLLRSLRPKSDIVFCVVTSCHCKKILFSVIKHAELNKWREIFYFIANGRKNLVLSLRRERYFRTILSQYQAGIP